MNDSKLLGDSGEHYALAMLGFANLACSKLPDNWKFYDLIVQKDSQIIRVNVKTRSETKSFSSSSWFIFDSTGQYDWVIFIIKFKNSDLGAWVIPLEIALKHSSVPKKTSLLPNSRRLSWRTLQKSELSKYKNNWQLAYFN